MANGKNGVRFPAQLFSRLYPRVVPGPPAANFALGGANITFDLLKIGYCAGLLLELRGTYTVAVADLVMLPRAPRNIFSRAIVQPPGAQPIINVGGHPLHVENYRRHWAAPFKNVEERTVPNLDANAGANDPIDTFPLPVGAQTFNLRYWIPFSRSAYDPTGSLPLGNRGQTQLILTPEAAANFVTTPANLTLFTCTILRLTQFTWAPFPEDPSVVPWDLTKVYTMEEQSQATVIGDNFVNVDSKDRIVALWHESWNTNIRADGEITNIDFNLDDSQYMQNLPTLPWWWYTKHQNGVAYPPGIAAMLDFDALHDADGASGKLYGPAFEPSKGPWINTAKIATVRSRLVKDATALANNPTIRTVVVREATILG